MYTYLTRTSGPNRGYLQSQRQYPRRKHTLQKRSDLVLVQTLVKLSCLLISRSISHFLPSHTYGPSHHGLKQRVYVSKVNQGGVPKSHLMLHISRLMNCLSYLNNFENTCSISIGLLLWTKTLPLKRLSRSAHLTMLWFSSPNSLSAQTGFSFDETKLEDAVQSMQSNHCWTIVAEMGLPGAGSPRSSTGRWQGRASQRAPIPPPPAREQDTPGSRPLHSAGGRTELIWCKTYRTGVV